MRRRTKRRIRRLGLVAVAIPIGAWALERAARQAEARGGRPAQLGPRLRHGANVLGRHGRGPLAPAVCAAQLRTRTPEH